MNKFITSEREQNKIIGQYYSFQAKIYDSTRWAFLFGRDDVIKHFPPLQQPLVAEIGCGTGYNLKRLINHYPDGKFYGIDLSGDMIERAERNLARHRNKVDLLQAPYQKGHKLFPRPADVILFSYSLTMINPQWQELIDQALEDLRVGGYLAVADFHNSRFPWFKSHMSNHHVRMDGHLLQYLKQMTPIEDYKICKAYGGIWDYMWCIARKES